MLNKQMEMFICAVEEGSFSKAARRLYMAPASLIQQMNLLEARLGMKLFDRGPSGISPTESGAYLYREAVEILKTSEAAIARARSLQGDENRVRIGTNLLFKCRRLGEFCSKLVDEHPEVKVEIVAVTSPGEKDWKPLAGIGFDYDLIEGLYLSEIHRNRCGFIELEKTPILPALPSGHRLLARNNLGPEDLIGETVVILKRGMSQSFDGLRDRLSAIDGINIIDVPFYGVDVFADCEINGHILMSPKNWQDVHPQLHMLSFTEEHCVPCGVMHANKLQKGAALLLDEIKKAAPKSQEIQA